MPALPRHNRFGVSSVVSLAVSISAAGAVAVSVADEPKPDAATLQATEKEPLRGVLTREQQAAYTPQKVLDKLLAGNRRFLVDDLTQRNHSQRIREAYEGGASSSSSRPSGTATTFCRTTTTPFPTSMPRHRHAGRRR